MLIGIDHGNYAIKTPGTEFVAGLKEHSVKPPISDEVLSYNGLYYTLTGKRISYMRDKTRDDRYFILTLFAIAKELAKAGRHGAIEDIQLAVGLPPEHYGTLREKFADYFKDRGVIEYYVGNQFYRIMIKDVFVFPQAYAAVAPRSDMIVKTVMVFIVDIGGYTTDVLLLRNGKPDLEYCMSLETGIITMNNEIIRKVNTLHDMKIEDDHIRAVIMGEDVMLPDEIRKTISEQAYEHANGILDQLRELQVDLRANPAIFLGGGSLVLKKYIKESPLVMMADFIEDSHANAIGYQMLAENLLHNKSGR